MINTLLGLDPSCSPFLIPDTRLAVYFHLLTQEFSDLSTFKHSASTISQQLSFFSPMLPRFPGFLKFVPSELGINQDIHLRIPTSGDPAKFRSYFATLAKVSISVAKFDIALLQDLSIT